MKKLACVLVVLGAMFLCACARTADSEPVKRYEMRGEVMRLDPQAKLATIKHEKIADWMDAMTMDFPVKEQQDFAKLKVGDKIVATVFVRGTDYWIGEIRSQ